MLMLSNKLGVLYDHRNLLMNFVSKEVKLKYKNSVLGFLWSFMNPIIMLCIYTFVFKYILKLQIQNFELFLFSGLLAWNFFNLSITMSSQSLLNQSNLIKKIYFPREIIPLSIVLSNLLNYFVMSLIVVIATLITEHSISQYIYLFPLIIVCTILFTSGIALLVSLITVKYRDVSYLIEVVLLFLFYMTPIVYSPDLVPEQYVNIINLNPVTQLVNLHRSVLLPNYLLEWTSVIVYVFVSLIVFFIGYALFKRGEMQIVENL